MAHSASTTIVELNKLELAASARTSISTCQPASLTRDRQLEQSRTLPQSASHQSVSRRLCYRDFLVRCRSSPCPNSTSGLVLVMPFVNGFAMHRQTTKEHPTNKPTNNQTNKQTLDKQTKKLCCCCRPYPGNENCFAQLWAATPKYQVLTARCTEGKVLRWDSARLL